MNKKYLSHHGIKGQRWGVRRYQNEDGTLTELGQKHYNTDGDYDSKYDKNSSDKLTRDYKMKDAAAAKAILNDTSKVANDAANAVGNIGKNKSKAINNKDYSKIKDDELRARINRLNMERTYGELTGDTKRVKSGSDWTREILQTVGAVVGIGGTIVGTIYTIKSIQNGKVPKAGGS